MQIGKKRSFLTKYSGNIYDWSYDKYISELNDCIDGCTWTDTPTMTKLSFTFKTLKYQSIQNNKVCFCGVSNGVWYVSYLDGTYDAVNLPLTTDYYNKSSAVQTPSRGFCFFSAYDGKVYIMDDGFGTNFRLLATTNITSSSWGGTVCIDYTGKYLYCWQQDSINGKIAKIEISTGTVQYFTLSGVTYSYLGLVLPDDTFLMTSINQVAYRFSSNFSLLKTQSHGQYAGWCNLLMVCRDQKVLFDSRGAANNTTYIDFYTLDGTSTYAFNTLWTVDAIRFLPNGMISLSQTSISESWRMPKQYGFFWLDPISGTITQKNIGLTCDDTHYVRSVRMLPDGKMLISYYNGSATDYYIADWKFSKRFSMDFLSSPWYLSRVN